MKALFSENRSIVLLAVVLCLVLEVGALAAVQSGGDAAPVLHTEIGARSIAMGGTGAAYGIDVTTGFRNPALLAHLQRPEMGAMHTELWLDTNLEYVGVAMPLSHGTVSFSGLLVNSPGILKTDDFGNIVGTFSYRDLAGILSYGIRLNGTAAVGVSLKGISSELDGSTGFGFGVDLGASVHPGGMKGLILGAAVQDVVSTGMVWASGTEKISPNIRLGVGYNLGETFGFALDYETQPAEWHIGGEYVVRDSVALRLGANPNGWTAGFGLRLGRGNVDYALADHETLGLTHRISATLGF